uniref:Uncharacterized protein n=1 Tax=Arundo donax TaxID=35708 RepID=A0A0A9BU28_ARUDO
MRLGCGFAVLSHLSICSIAMTSGTCFSISWR